jgi:gluconolactonase
MRLNGNLQPVSTGKARVANGGGAPCCSRNEHSVTIHCTIQVTTGGCAHKSVSAHHREYEMFAAPPEQTAEIFTRLPDEMRMRDRPSEWVRVRREGAQTDCFLEGPSFDRSGNLYVVDIAYGRIFRISPDATWTTAAEYDGAPNGLKIHKDGMIYVADKKCGIMKMDPTTGRIAPHCTHFGSEKFNGINDLYFAKNGDLYFTDQGDSDLRHPTGRVFRLRSEGEPELLLGGIPGPNGLAMSNDERSLFVAVTRANCVWRLHLKPNNQLGRVSLFIQLSGSVGYGPDGLAVDEADNLAIAHYNMGSVWQFNVFGEPTLRIRSPVGIGTSNIAYGWPNRKMLYITESETGTILRSPTLGTGRLMYSHS